MARVTEPQGTWRDPDLSVPDPFCPSDWWQWTCNAAGKTNFLVEIFLFFFALSVRKKKQKKNDVVEKVFFSRKNDFVPGKNRRYRENDAIKTTLYGGFFNKDK